MPNADLLLPHRMMNALAVRCDGAVSRDDRGFDGTGARRGNNLALKPVTHWTPKDVWQAYRIAQRHTRQLGILGHDATLLIEPDYSDDDRLITIGAAGSTPDGTTIQLGRADSFVVYAPYGDRLTDALWNEIPLAQRNRQPLLYWQVAATPDTAEALLAVAARLGVSISDEAIERLRGLLTGPSSDPACDIDCHDTGWVVQSSRRPDVIAAIKTIPYPSRRWGQELFQPGWVIAASAANATQLRAIAYTFGLRWSPAAWQRAESIIQDALLRELNTPTVADPPQSPPPLRIIHRLPDGDWSVTFPPDQRANGAIGRIRGTRWQGPISRYWRVPGTANATKSLLHFSTSYDVPFADDATFTLAKEIAATAAPIAHRAPRQAPRPQGK